MTCKKMLNRINKHYPDILGDNLVGIYIHGSIAFKCFNWEKSDIDFIIVVNNPLDIDTKLKLMNISMELNEISPKKGLEFSIVLKQHCINFQYPTPYELHFSNSIIDEYKRDPMAYCAKTETTDIDLAAHFTIIKQVGIVLQGDPIENIFGEIPKENYKDSIIADIALAKENCDNNPVQIILNLCRTFAYFKEDLILSKEQGGEWCLQNVNHNFHNMISQAIDCYKTEKIMMICENGTDDFYEHILNAINVSI